LETGRRRSSGPATPVSPTAAQSPPASCHRWGSLQACPTRTSGASGSGTARRARRQRWPARRIGPSAGNQSMKVRQATAPRVWRQPSVCVFGVPSSSPRKRFNRFQNAFWRPKSGPLTQVLKPSQARLRQRPPIPPVVVPGAPVGGAAPMAPAVAMPGVSSRLASRRLASRRAWSATRFSRVQRSA